jgi:hypothetical protein
MYLRKLASAFGAGSVAMTSSPRARYSAAQLAPMTPVPTMAMRRIGLLYDMIFLRLFGLKFNGLTNSPFRRVLSLTRRLPRGAQRPVICSSFSG